MNYHCKRCKKPLEVATFFCPECEEQSIQKLAQMMEEKKKGTGQSSQPPAICTCPNPKILEKSYCTECGRDIHPPPTKGG